MSAAIEQFAKELLAEFGPQLIAAIREAKLDTCDPLLTVRQAAKRLKLGEHNVRALIAAGTLYRAPDITSVRIRQSVVDAFGTAPKSK